MLPIACGSLCREKMIIIVFVLVVTLANGFKLGQRIPTFAGPYRIIVSHITNTSNDYNSTGTYWLRLRTTQVRGKRLQYGWGTAHIEKPLGDNVKVQIRMAVRSNNQWKKNAFVHDFDNACTFFETHAKSIANLVLGRDYPCPYPAIGQREIRNQSFEFTFPKFPTMPYGRYLFTLALTRDRVTVGLAETVVDLAPRLE